MEMVAVVTLAVCVCVCTSMWCNHNNPTIKHSQTIDVQGWKSCQLYTDWLRISIHRTVEKYRFTDRSIYRDMPVGHVMSIHRCIDISLPARDDSSAAGQTETRSMDFVPCCVINCSPRQAHEGFLPTTERNMPLTSDRLVRCDSVSCPQTRGVTAPSDRYTW